MKLSSPLLVAAASALVLSAPAAAQRLDPGLTRTVIQDATASNPDPVRLGQRLVDVDGALTDLLYALHERHGIRYSIPAKADPIQIRESTCGSCDNAQFLRRGYAALQSLMAELESALEEEAPDVRSLQRQAEEAALLAWALKGYAFVEAMDVADADMEPGDPQGAAILGWIGLGLTIYGWYGTYESTGDVVDAFADNRERHRDRRRQAELVGLNYPNACWQTYFTTAEDCN